MNVKIYKVKKKYIWNSLESKQQKNNLSHKFKLKIYREK